MRWTTAPKPEFEPYRRLPLFTGCSDEQLAKADSLLSELSVPAARQLLAQGAPSRELIVIVEGLVVVTKDSKPLALLGPGDVVGEMGFLDGGRRTAAVETLTPVRLLVGNLAEADALCRVVPGLAAALRRLVRMRS